MFSHLRFYFDSLCILLPPLLNVYCLHFPLLLVELSFCPSGPPTLRSSCFRWLQVRFWHMSQHLCVLSHLFGAGWVAPCWPSQRMQVYHPSFTVSLWHRGRKSSSAASAVVHHVSTVTQNEWMKRGAFHIFCDVRSHTGRLHLHAGKQYSVEWQ